MQHRFDGFLISDVTDLLTAVTRSGAQPLGLRSTGVVAFDFYARDHEELAQRDAALRQLGHVEYSSTALLAAEHLRFEAARETGIKRKSLDPPYLG